MVQQDFQRHFLIDNLRQEHLNQYNVVAAPQRHIYCNANVNTCVRPYPQLITPREPCVCVTHVGYLHYTLWYHLRCINIHEIQPQVTEQGIANLQFHDDDQAFNANYQIEGTLTEIMQHAYPEVYQQEDLELEDEDEEPEEEWLDDQQDMEGDRDFGLY